MFQAGGLTVVGQLLDTSNIDNAVDQVGNIDIALSSILDKSKEYVAS
jgi:hypothetical protein